MRISEIGLAAIAALSLSGEAQAAACRIQGITAPGVSTVYDPFDEGFSPSPVPVSIQVAGDDCTGAKLELAFVPTTTNPRTGDQARLVQGGGVILATIIAAGQPRQIVNAGAAFTTNPLLLSVGSAGSIAGDASIALSVQSGQISAPGTYVSDVQLLARLTDTHGKQSQAAALVNLAVTVKPSVRVAAGSGQLAIDLGELTPGTTGGPVTFDAYANVDYNLMLSSDNGFVMRRNGSETTAPGVPYTPVLSGGSIASIAGGGKASRRQALFDAPADGMRHHSLSVKVDNFTDVAAGQYSDIMTLEIRARV